MSYTFRPGYLYRIEARNARIGIFYNGHPYYRHVNELFKFPGFIIPAYNFIGNVGLEYELIDHKDFKSIPGYSQHCTAIPGDIIEEAPQFHLHKKTTKRCITYLTNWQIKLYPEFVSKEKAAIIMWARLTTH